MISGRLRAAIEAAAGNAETLRVGRLTAADIVIVALWACRQHWVGRGFRLQRCAAYWQRLRCAMDFSGR
jgi:hypothetical protein